MRVYECCPADQEVGHEDGCPNEGINPKIHCGDCFGIAPSREKRLDSDTQGE